MYKRKPKKPYNNESIIPDDDNDIVQIWPHNKAVDDDIGTGKNVFIGSPSQIIDNLDRIVIHGSKISESFGKETMQEGKENSIINIMLTEPIWEQQRNLNETDRQYLFFKTFASIPPGGRNTRAAYRKWVGRYDPNKSTPDLKPSEDFVFASKTFFWEERAAARDAYLLDFDQDDWLSKDRERRERDYQIAEKLREKALTALENIQIDELSPTMIVRFLEVASTLQRNSIPKTQLEKDEINDLMGMLPSDKKEQVIAILMSRAKGNG